MSGSLLSIATMLSIAWLIPTSEFGLGMVVLSVTQMVASAIEIVFADYAVASPSLDARDLRSLNAANLIVACLTACAFLGAGAFAAGDTDWARIGPALMAASAALVCSGLSAMPTALLKRDLAFGALTRRTWLVRVLSCGVGVALAAWGCGLWALVAQQLAFSVTNALVLTTISPVGFAKPESRALVPALKFLAGNFVPSLMAGNVNRLLIFLVGTTTSPAAAGFVAMAARILDAVTFPVLGGIGQATLPLIVRARSRGVGSAEVFERATLLTCAAAMPVFFGLGACAPALVGTVLAPEWAPAASLLAILAMERALRISRAVAPPLLTAIGRPEVNLHVTVADLALGYGLLLFGSTFGDLAAIGAWCLKSLVYLPLSAYGVKRVAGVPLTTQARAAWPPLVASALMVGAAALTANLANRVPWLEHPPLVLLLQAAVGATVYGISIIGLAPDSLHSIAQTVFQPLRLRWLGHDREL